MKFVGVPRKGHQSMDPQSKDSWERAWRKHLTEFIFLVIFLRLHTLCMTFMTGEKSHQSMDRHFIWGKLQEDITEASNQAHVSCHFSSLTHCVHYLYDRRKKSPKHGPTFYLRKVGRGITKAANHLLVFLVVFLGVHDGTRTTCIHSLKVWPPRCAGLA